MMRRDARNPSGAMDPLTHTLVGASLAATRLGKTTRLAGPALLFGANLPDVDVVSYFAGADAALGARRGLTHGVPALVILPAVLAGILWLRGRRSAVDDPRPLKPSWLLALTYLATLTHPALDWLNNYGMRWWLPFRDSWSYGDAVFIMDPWLWLVLGGFWLSTRRPTLRLGVGIAVIIALLSILAALRAPGSLPVVGAVVALMALIFLLPPPERAATATRLPAVGLAVAVVYIGGLLTLQGVTERRVRAALDERLTEPVEALMVGPIPTNPLRWDVVAQTGAHYRYGAFDWRTGARLELADERLRAARPTAVWRTLEERGQIPGFRRWARFPWIEEVVPAGDGRIYVMDARYVRRRTTGFGGAAVERTAR